MAEFDDVPRFVAGEDGIDDLSSNMTESDYDGSMLPAAGEQEPWTPETDEASEPWSPPAPEDDGTRTIYNVRGTTSSGATFYIGTLTSDSIVFDGDIVGSAPQSNAHDAPRGRGTDNDWGNFEENFKGWPFEGEAPFTPDRTAEGRNLRGRNISITGDGIIIDGRRVEDDDFDD